MYTHTHTVSFFTSFKNWELILFLHFVSFLLSFFPFLVWLPFSIFLPLFYFFLSFPMFIHSLLAYSQEKWVFEFSRHRNHVHLSFIQERMGIGEMLQTGNVPEREHAGGPPSPLFSTKRMRNVVPGNCPLQHPLAWTWSLQRSERNTGLMLKTPWTYVSQQLNITLKKQKLCCLKKLPQTL